MKKVIILSCLFVMHINGMESKDNSKKEIIKLLTEEEIEVAATNYAREKVAIDNYLKTYQRTPYESRWSDKFLRLMIHEQIQFGTLIMNAEGCLVESQKEVDFLADACKDATKPLSLDPQDFHLFIHEHGLQECQIPNYRNKLVIKKFMYMQADDTDWLSRHRLRHPRPNPLSPEEVQKILDVINGDKK